MAWWASSSPEGQQGNAKSYDDPRMHDNPQCQPSETVAAIFPCKQEMLHADRLKCLGCFAWRGHISPAQKCLKHWFSHGPDSTEIGKGRRAVPWHFPANLGTGCCQNTSGCRGYSSCFCSQHMVASSAHVVHAFAAALWHTLLFSLQSLFEAKVPRSQRLFWERRNVAVARSLGGVVQQLFYFEIGTKLSNKQVLLVIAPNCCESCSLMPPMW